MNSYIQLKDSQPGSVYWKLKVQFTGTFEAIEQPMTLERTATNKASLTVGLPYYVARGVARLPVSPAAGYASIARFKTWASGGIADRTMSMIDHENVTRNVIFVSQWMPEYLSPVYDGSEAYILCPFEVQQA